MTKEEVKQLLMVIQATYPNFNMLDKQAAVNAWHMFLQEYDSNIVLGAFKAYVQSNTTGFAPSVSQILTMLNKPDELNEMTDAEAWTIVAKAIRNGTYHYKEEYEKFSPELKKAVGSADQLYYWATDEDFNEQVVMSLVQRNYRNVMARKHEFKALPPELQLQVKGNLMIGENSQ